MGLIRNCKKSDHNTWKSLPRGRIMPLKLFVAYGSEEGTSSQRMRISATWTAQIRIKFYQAAADRTAGKLYEAPRGRHTGTHTPPPVAVNPSARRQPSSCLPSWSVSRGAAQHFSKQPDHLCPSIHWHSPSFLTCRKQISQCGRSSVRQIVPFRSLASPSLFELIESGLHKLHIVRVQVSAVQLLSECHHEK